MPDDGTIQEFLSRIAKIESANRYNPVPAHKVMPGGLHKGMQAVGKYGLMPLTIADLIAQRQQDADAAQQQTELPGNTPTPEEALAHKLSLPQPIPASIPASSQEYRDRAEAMGQHVDVSHDGQEVLAQYLAKKLLDKTGGDQERAAYMWNMGHNRVPDEISPKTLDKKDYVQKFRVLDRMDNPEVPQLQEASRKDPRPKKKFKVLNKKSTPLP